MRAGELRHRVTLEERTQTVASEGGVTPKGLGVDTVSAAVEPLSGDEAERAGHVEGTVTHRVRIRFRPDVSPKMRIRHVDRILEVVSVVDKDERNRELWFMCREVAG